ncbi:DUF2059 domain-containing protein [Rhodoblastus sp. 17X3]|uniref:DUF2059 domain-containing protein n=1 Tax=Rhodoblastus sp. 17X3 TaxID=3047026 RepID=UPI0024B69949|nr:DUF2059 domain-containing protein [Rhodoblastus sp. 17X3]MDI9847713.1 DUF2059 domain-containing protein [Rhodoblastus sp. 17X3]
MRAFARTLAAVAALALLGAASARAQDSAPGQIEEKLKGYEPATVAAAESFARSFNLGGMVQKSAPFLVQSVNNLLRTKNPELTDEQAQDFVSAFLQNLFGDNGKILERAMVLDMVEIMSRDELEALIRFQSTPVGASALKKMPTLSARMAQIMPLMQTYVVPRAMESAQAQMRKNGVEVKI